jgi:hypothetical protein
MGKKKKSRRDPERLEDRIAPAMIAANFCEGLDEGAADSLASAGEEPVAASLSPEAAERFQEFAARLQGEMAPEEVRQAFEEWADELDPEAPLEEMRQGFERNFQAWLDEGAPPFPEEGLGVDDLTREPPDAPPEDGSSGF